MKTHLLIIAALLAALTTTLPLKAQDADIMQIASEARQKQRTPQGDRHHYGLRYRDLLMAPPPTTPRWESAEDSARQRQEFVRLCAEAFRHYDQRDALGTVVYGDSALRTGFDNLQIYAFMANSYEELGDDERALEYFKKARTHGVPGGKEALAAFKKRMKARRKQQPPQ